MHEMMWGNFNVFRRPFEVSAGIVLLVTGLAKVWSATGPARVLDVTDPLVGIPLRHLMLGVGLLELFIAFFCLFTDKWQFSLLAIAWLATNFVVHRLGLLWIGWRRPCGCIGNLTDMLHISPQTADTIMKVYLAKAADDASLRSLQNKKTTATIKCSGADVGASAG